jgi:hypothetical protein
MASGAVIVHVSGLGAVATAIPFNVIPVTIPVEQSN